jgi:hypothetical protein
MKNHGRMMTFLNSFGAEKIAVVPECRCCAVCDDTNPAAVEEMMCSALHQTTIMDQ